MSYPRACSDDVVRKLREWRNTPRAKRGRTLAGMAAVLGVNYEPAKRAAYGMRHYAKVQP